MTNLATALTNVLEANRRLSLEQVRWALVAGNESAVRNAATALDTMAGEYTEALEQHIKAEIIRAVASMPGHTTEQV